MSIDLPAREGDLNGDEAVMRPRVDSLLPDSRHLARLELPVWARARRELSHIL